MRNALADRCPDDLLGVKTLLNWAERPIQLNFLPEHWHQIEEQCRIYFLEEWKAYSKLDGHPGTRRARFVRPREKMMSFAHRL